MTTSSEDVLLQIPQVRFKKGDGTLFLMDQRLIWMVENKATVAVSHLYADIKSQKISPEGKAKIQLQVVLHNGVSSTFHFTNKMGLQSQLEDRDKVKEMLQTLLPKFKRKVDRELEEKNKLLSSNPALLQLYKDLVMTEVVTSEEFWNQHAVKYTQKQKQQPQEIGVSGAFLADIKPQTDGCNGLKYNITPDIIECIFKTYPAVKKKYLDNVPAKLSESQFWTKFFQSHYFHRDRKYAESKDIFTECGKMDDQEMKRDIQKGVDDPLVNITEFEDKTLDEGYGTSVEKVTINTGTVSQAMIKRFNQHSIMVLKANKNKAGDLNNQNSVDNKSNSKESNGMIGSNKESTIDEPVKKKQRIKEKITYDDLDSNDNNKNKSSVQLNLSKVERYLHGPMPDTISEHINPNEGSSILRQVFQEAKQWNVGQTRHSSHSLLSPAAAVGALGELSPGGALMRGFQEQSLAPGQEEKALKMHEALNRYHTARLKPFEDKLIRELSPLSHHLTKHLNQLLNAAYQKFGNWQKLKNR
ncbi:hypothetical protein WA026_015549 [Henosepilachna vigintioctopunctata]|uniref:General transcription factor IIH subunit 1 n=1 Tax=Henosepilachna vigintioctopunctata TaxID=420089 RepID=A0AAW1V8D5_9CUCU